jgi:Alginate export
MPVTDAQTDAARNRRQALRWTGLRAPFKHWAQERNVTVPLALLATLPEQKFAQAMQPAPRTRASRTVAGAACLLSCASVVVSAQPALEERATFEPARQEEDWSALRNPALRSGTFDGLKYIALGDSGKAYASFGGEIRLTAERLRNEDWGAIRGSDSYALTRLMLHSQVVVRDWAGLDRVRFWAELKHGSVGWRQSPARPPDKDALDFNGLFIEGTKAVGDAGELSMRIGRQELHYGAGRLISVREGPNTRRPFDGALMRFKTGTAVIDAFYAQPNETDKGVFDNGRVAGERVWGLYAVVPHPVWKDFKLDLIYIGSKRPARYDQGSGDERRHTTGFRWHTTGPVLKHDLLAVVQLGSFEDRRGTNGKIRSWTLSSDTAFTAVKLPLKPTLGVFFGYTPGDKDPGNTDLQTFRAPYPPGRYFGFGSPLGPGNLVFVRPRLSLVPGPGWTVEVGCYGFWREQRGDGIYNPNGGLLRSGSGSQARQVGYLPEITAEFKASENLALAVELARFHAGRFLRETTPGADITYGAVRMTFKF